MATIRIPTADEIKKIREKLGLLQSEAAERIGVTQGQWSAWERGHKRPSRQSALLISLLSKKKI